MGKGNEISINVSLVFMRDQNDKKKKHINTIYGKRKQYYQNADKHVKTLC